MFTVLIVDDNPSDRKGIRDMMEWEALDIDRVEMASNGMEGIRKAEEIRPDFIIADVSMPLLDGIKMAERIKSAMPDVKIIFMSCFDEFDYVKNAIALNAFGYVLKPIRLDEMSGVLRKAKAAREEELMHAQMQERLAKLHEQLPQLRERFFQELLVHPADPNNLEERIRFLDIPFTDRTGYFVLEISIDPSGMNGKRHSVEKGYLHVLDIKQAAEAALLTYYFGYTLEQQYDTVSYLILLNADGPDETRGDFETLMERLVQLQEELRRKNLSVTIGVSHMRRKLDELAEAREEAGYAVRSKFFDSGDRIILASDIKAAVREANYDLQEVKNQISALLEKGEAVEVRSFLDRYFGQESNLSEASARSLTLAIVTIARTLLLEKNVIGEKVRHELDSSWETVTAFETIGDLKLWLTDVLAELCAAVASEQGSRYQAIVADMKAYIKAHYAECQNIEDVVKPLYMSVSHANVIFKQQTGMTLFDYLLRTRMEAAKEMLCDPYIKVYEVVERVGYKSIAYFGSAFKQYTGLTPKQFMDRHAGRQVKKDV